MQEKPFLWQHVQHWASVDPDFTALRYGALSHTYGELDQMTDNMATAFLSAGIRPGDMIATILPASPEYIMTLVAADKLGAGIAALDVKYREADLKRFLSHVRPKAVLSVEKSDDTDLALMLESLLPEVAPEQDIPLYILGEGGAGRPFSSLYLPDSSQRALLADCKTSQKPDDGLLVIFTGGTTGLPKSALLSKENVAAMAETEARVLSRAMEEFGITGRIKSIACLPPSHVGGSVEMIGSALAAGNEIIVHDTWSPKRFLSAVEKEAVPWIGGVPTMYAIMLLLPELDTFDLSSLKLAILSGERVKPDLLQQIRSRICPNIMIGYGSTEAGAEISFTRPGDSLERLADGYVGTPLEGVEIRIADGKGNPLPAGETGEIQVRGKLTISRYFNMPEEDAQGFTPDGFCRTGDLGALTPDGELYIHGRLKHIIRVGSYTVMPSEVEEVALGHPSVGMAAAIGVPDDIYGETVLLVVSPAPGQTVVPREITDHCAARLAKFKVPRSIIVEPDMPVTRIGKVHRVELQNRITHSMKGKS